MKKIEILKKIEYKKHPIYIRKIGNMFEYMVIFKNELYSNHIVINRPLLTEMLNVDYTERQLRDCVALAIKGAKITIDELIK